MEEADAEAAAVVEAAAFRVRVSRVGRSCLFPRSEARIVYMFCHSCGSTRVAKSGSMQRATTFTHGVSSTATLCGQERRRQQTKKKRKQLGLVY